MENCFIISSNAIKRTLRVKGGASLHAASEETEVFSVTECGNTVSESISVEVALLLISSPPGRQASLFLVVVMTHAAVHHP
jgi:hypothetical protein